MHADKYAFIPARCLRDGRRLVDPEARAIDVYRLAGSSYERPERFDGENLVDLPPFLALALDPVALWQ